MRTPEEKIARGETAIARKRAAGEPVPPEWEKRLAELKTLAAQDAQQGAQARPQEAPRYTRGCLYDFIPGRRVRPILHCVSHPGCPREVVLWRDGLLAELFTLEKLVGKARKDGEAEWARRGNGGKP